MVYMFNELSIQKVSSRNLVIELLGKFVDASAAGREIGFNEMRLHENFNNLYRFDICDTYNIDDWLNDSTINKDIRDKFRLIVTSSPLITNEELTYSDSFQLSEFYFNINDHIYQVYGLGAAYIYETLSISLSTLKDWEESTIDFTHKHLDDSGELLEKQVSVRNICDVKTLDNHRTWWQDVQAKCLQKSIELWEKRGDFFQNLIFCIEVENQLKKIGVNKVLFQIIDRLTALDNYTKGWKEGSFNYEAANRQTNLRISPESDSTLSKYSSLRRFTIPDKGKKVFDLHIKTGDLRFHFYPDNENKKVYIGYIGKHLRIASED